MSEEASKREEDRIARTLNNVGRRGARPVSWNVAQSSGLAGGPLGGSIGRNQQSGLKTLQEQLREEERKQPLQAPPPPTTTNPAEPVRITGLRSGSFGNGRNSSLDSRDSGSVESRETGAGIGSGRNSSLGSGRNSSLENRDSSVGSGRNSSLSSGRNSSLGNDVDEESEKERKIRQEEDRLNRWMRKGDAQLADAKAHNNDVRARSVSVDSVAFSDLQIATSPGGSKLTDVAVRFQDQMYQASKSIRQKNIDDVAKFGFGAAIAAKSIAELLSNDVDIVSKARHVEEGVSLMRADQDPENTQQHLNDVAGYLGQLFISTIGAL